MYQRKRHRRPVPTDAHEGSRRDYLRRHEAAARAAAAGTDADRAAFLDKLFDVVTDTRTLLLAAEHLRREGGPAPGVDGISPTDLDMVDLVALVTELRQRLRDGSYRPAPERKVEKSKGPGRGTRTLSLAVVADRVLQRAILLAVQQYIDPQLLPTTFGGRPGYSTADALIAAEKAAGTGSWAWVVADVRKAFDEIPHDRLKATIRQWFGDTRVADLITGLVTAGRAVGVPQGGALSMLLLNLFLHDHLDQPMTKTHPAWTLVRWVDDLLIITKNPKEAEYAQEYLTTRLDEAGMTLKDTKQVTNLGDNESAHWLGLQISRAGNELHPTIAPGARDELTEKLNQPHREDRPTQHAREVIRGWIAAHGVVKHNRGDVEVLTGALEECDLTDAATPDEITTWWGAAHQRYLTRRNGSRGDGQGMTPGQDVGGAEGPTASPVGTFLANTVPNAATDAAHSCTPDLIEEGGDDRSEIGADHRPDEERLTDTNAGAGRPAKRIEVRIRPFGTPEDVRLRRPADPRRSGPPGIPRAGRDTFPARRPRAGRRAGPNPPADARPPP